MFGIHHEGHLSRTGLEWPFLFSALLLSYSLTMVRTMPQYKRPPLVYRRPLIDPFRPPKTALFRALSTSEV